MQPTVADSRELPFGRTESSSPERMQSALSIVRSAWRARGRARRGDDALDFAASLNIDELSARLGVERRAQSDHAGKPAPAAERAAAASRNEILHHFRELHRRARHRATSTAETLRVAGADTDLVEALETLRDLPSRTEQQLRRLMAQHQGRLELVRDREARQEESYERFREANRLHRVAEYPQPRWLHSLMMVALVFLGLIVVNRFAPQVSAGIAALAGGAVPSIALAITGVLVTFMLGGVLRERNHVHPGRRLVGWLAGVLGITLTAAAAVLIAHAAARGGAAQMVGLQGLVESMIREPAAFLVDLSGVWHVLATVLLAGLAALLIGYRADDAYPGYGAAQRGLYQARKAREALNKRLLARTNAIIDGADAEAQSIPRQQKQAAQRYARLQAELQSIPAHLSAYEAALEQACAAVLERYRRASERYGAAQPGGGSADEAAAQPALAEEGTLVGVPGATPILERETLREERAAMERMQQGLKEVEAEAVRIRQRIRDLNWLAIRELAGDEQPAA